VIDPGDEGGRIIALLDRLKLIPAYILLTHGHFDHIGAVPFLAEEYRGRCRGDCKIAIHAADAEYLGPDSRSAHNRSFIAAGGDTASLQAIYREKIRNDMPPPDRALEEGDTVGPFTVLHLPGHTPGSIGLWDKKEGVLFSGDTLFCGDYGRTDLPGGSETQMFASLKRLSTLDGGIRVFPGHGPATTIEREVSSGLNTAFRN
jgi:glyoxylase-like metal-dependent hydrolase (beta-lactamase superfamily II)